MSSPISSAKDADIGMTIFDDNHGFLSYLMFAGYILTAPPKYCIIDLLIYFYEKRKNDENKKNN